MEAQDQREPDQMAFGEALAELETIVAALEGGELDLEDSLIRYERGVKLMGALQSKLSDAQQKITMLVGELEADGDTEDNGA
ncbi:MAG: exodeoxyribonuclease VII small subunit [Coriobacteriia bacterium]|jgi:exodeoxyribonuclease VII small subunit|nr:exodeoxyribonuclease VII small subunit [Coriobacteriia bacterium]